MELDDMAVAREEREYTLVSRQSKLISCQIDPLANFGEIFTALGPSFETTTR